MYRPPVTLQQINRLARKIEPSRSQDLVEHLFFEPPNELSVVITLAYLYGVVVTAFGPEKNRALIAALPEQPAHKEDVELDKQLAALDRQYAKTRKKIKDKILRTAMKREYEWRKEGIHAEYQAAIAPEALRRMRMNIKAIRRFIFNEIRR